MTISGNRTEAISADSHTQAIYVLVWSIHDQSRNEPLKRPREYDTRIAN